MYVHGFVSIPLELAPSAHRPTYAYDVNAAFRAIFLNSIKFNLIRFVRLRWIRINHVRLLFVDVSDVIRVPIVLDLTRYACWRNGFARRFCLSSHCRVFFFVFFSVRLCCEGLSSVSASPSLCLSLFCPYLSSTSIAQSQSSFPTLLIRIYQMDTV